MLAGLGVPDPPMLFFSYQKAVMSATDIAVTALIDKYKVAAQTNPTSLAFGDVFALLQKFATGLVGNILANKFSFDPATMENMAMGYIDTFYTTVIQPLEIAHLPGGMLSEALMHSIFTSVARTSVHTLIALVLRTQTATAGAGVAAENITETLIKMGQPA
jgi:hypothetical protein